MSKKPHIIFFKTRRAYCATVTGELSWTPMLCAYGNGETIREAIQAAWMNWEHQVNSDMDFPWIK